MNKNKALLLITLTNIGTAIGTTLLCKKLVEQAYTKEFGAVKNKLSKNSSDSSLATDDQTNLRSKTPTSCEAKETCKKSEKEESQKNKDLLKKIEPDGSNYIINDPTGIANHCLSKMFLLEGYRIYVKSLNAVLQEGFSMECFLNEKSILFITYSNFVPEETEKAEKLLDSMKKEAGELYKNDNGGKYHHVTFVQNSI